VPYLARLEYHPLLQSLSIVACDLVTFVKLWCIFAATIIPHCDNLLLSIEITCKQS